MKSTGPFETERITIVIIAETKNANGETAEDRQYGFRRANVYGNEHNLFTELDLMSNKPNPVFVFYFMIKLYQNSGILFPGASFLVQQ